MRRRIDDAAKGIDFVRLGIGPQCGFASTMAGKPFAGAKLVPGVDLVG